MTWATWQCPRCGQQVELHDLTPVEAWCLRCRRALEAVDGVVEEDR
jgi:endogenous inhibitor of DNA gyrase (YacG/DUF329 family)